MLRKYKDFIKRVATLAKIQMEASHQTTLIDN